MTSFDYVIVGAGSAGCVLANRLSEDPGVRVLVLEAGGKDRHPDIKIPAAFGNQFQGKLDWNFSTEPEPAVDGRSLYVPRGKSLGGSSSMNAMLYVRGRPLDYAYWEDQGAPGWGWDDVLPYFKKAENNARGASEFHGAGGPLEVAEQRSPRPLNQRLLAASEEAGIPYTRDYNGPEQDGVSPFQVLQKNGRRWSAADGYLRPAMKRANVEVRTGVHVLGLDIDGSRVTGVRYRDKKGREQTVRAERETLLSAGAIQSPQVLLLSGIGDPDELRAAGVEPRHELPGVGRNLMDHPFVSCIWEVSDENTLYGADAPKNLLEWVTRRTGPLSSTVAEVCAFTRTRPGLAAADVQFHMGAAFYEDHGFEEYEGHCAVIAPVLVSPKARGQVWLRSSDPLDKPRILTNSLSEPDDVDSLVAGMELAREIASQGPLAEIVLKELKPGPDVVDRTELEADLRRRLMLIYHPAGTCRMSDDADGAVVDSQLRVHGLEGLRVVDASVFPLVPGGNTHAPTVMVAEKAADLIREAAPVPRVTRSVETLVVGAGFGGLATAVSLEQDGVDYVVLEKAEDLGGVWRENVYPGAACDIPSALYSFSYAQRKDWSRPCPMQPEVLDYLHEVAGRYGVGRKIVFGTEATAAHFDEATARWTVQTGGGDTYDAGSLVVACGQLSRPFTPELDGRDSFAGTQFHSAEWDRDFDPTGKRIAVIGTGASAIQFVPELAETAARVDVYQRTPPWMLPRRNNAYARWARRAIETLPGLQSIRRAGIIAFAESGILGQTRLPLVRTTMRLWATWHMRNQVKDPVLRQKIWPDYPIGCKRVLFSSKYLPALGRPNVELITEPVVRLEADGPVDDTGAKREVDAVVWGTGFKSQEFVAPMEVRGSGGEELAARWSDGARAHLGVQVSGFPNLFLIYGPNTNLGFGSIIVMIEAQVRYVTDALRALRSSPADAFDVRADVERRSTEEVQDRLQKSVWTNCESWYQADNGRIVNNWPGQMAEYVQATRHVDPADQKPVYAGG